MRLFFILLSTLISNATMAQEASTKVVLEDMGNVGYRITDAQILVDWVTSGIRPRVGRENIMYEGLLKSKKDLQRRLGRTETHDAQSKEIESLLTSCSAHCALFSFYTFCCMVFRIFLSLML